MTSKEKIEQASLQAIMRANEQANTRVGKGTEGPWDRLYVNDMREPLKFSLPPIF